jgi:hypothetical protein
MRQALRFSMSIACDKDHQFMFCTKSVHAVEEPGSRLQYLRADAPMAAKPQCALKGDRPLLGTPCE